MSTARRRFVFGGVLLLAPCALLGLRQQPTSRDVPAGRVLWEGADTAQAVAFSPDGTTLALGTGVFNGSDGVGVVDLATGGQVASFPGHKNHVMSLAFSGDGRTLTSASYEAVRRWDVSAGEARARAMAISAYNASLTLSPHGQTLALARQDAGGAVELVSPADGAARLLGALPPQRPNCLAFSRDGHTLAACNGYSVRLWDLDTGRARGLPAGVDPPVGVIAISADGRTLASAGMDGMDWFVRLCDLTTGAARDCGRGNDGWVNCLAFSPDGRTLAYGGLDGTVRLWDAAGGEPVVLRGHTDWVNAVAFAPDGRSLASASSDRTVRLWELDARE